MAFLAVIPHYKHIMLRLMRTPQDDEPEGIEGGQTNNQADKPDGKTHEGPLSAYRQLFDSIESALSNDEPFTYHVTNENRELQSVGILVAIHIMLQQGKINLPQALTLKEKATQTMRAAASSVKKRRNEVSPADIRAQQGALALFELELEFRDQDKSRPSRKDHLLNAIRRDQTGAETDSTDTFASKSMLITIFRERAGEKITPTEALELVESFCKNLEKTGEELGILDLAGLYTETFDGKRLLTPTDMETVLGLVRINKADIVLLASMFPEGMEIWEKACPDLPAILLEEKEAAANSGLERQETDDTALPRQPGLLARNRLLFATAALAVIAAAGAITRTSWEGSSSGEDQPSVKISTLPSEEATPQSPPAQSVPKTAQATKNRVAETLLSKPATKPIKIASSHQAPTQPIPAPASAPQVAEAAPTLTIPISTKSGPIGPQFDEAGSTKQWEATGWTVKIGLRPGGKKSYTLTKNGQTLKVISPKVTAGQATLEAEQVQ